MLCKLVILAVASWINFDDVLFLCTLEDNTISYVHHRMDDNNIKFFLYKTYYTCIIVELFITSIYTPLHPHTSCHYMHAFHVHWCYVEELPFLGRLAAAFIHTLANWGQERDRYIHHMHRALNVHTVYPPHSSQVLIESTDSTITAVCIKSYAQYYWQMADQLILQLCYSLTQPLCVTLCSKL